MSERREIKGATAEEKYWSLSGHLSEMEKELAHLEPAPGTLYLEDYCVDIENTLDGGLTEEDGEAYWQTMFNQASSAAAYRAQDYGFDINDHFTRPIF